MKKLCFVLLALVFVLSCQAQSQNDFYGTWVKEDEKLRLEYIFDKTHLITITTQLDPNWAFFFKPERVVWEISSWESVKNADNSDYSYGVKIGVRGINAVDVATFYISRDKNSIKKSNDMETVYYRDAYLQELKKDFYGTWEITGKRGVIFTDKVLTLVYGASDLYSHDILSWKIIINNDIDTKTDFPVGFYITARDSVPSRSSYNIEGESYLHRDKKSLLQINRRHDNTHYNWIFNKIK